MMNSVFWGGLQRFAEAACHAAPTILVGLVIAGVFRRLLGHEYTRWLFGGTRWRSLPIAWVIGMLLPVCSLGVIPISRELKRAGLSGGTILAFAITAPLFNPLSVLYGLTLSDPLTILGFSLCSLVVVSVVGVLWDVLFPDSVSEEPAPAAVAYGWRRMLAMGVVVAREIAGRSAVFILIGLLGVAVMVAFLPPGKLQTAMERDNLWAPLTMTAVAIPAYATPMVAMSQLGSMFQHANSIGAAFALLALGAGMNLGLLAWMAYNYGARRAMALLAILIAVVLALGYAMVLLLPPSGVDPPGHTHAFDRYCAPYPAGTSNLPTLVASELSKEVLPHEFQTAMALVALALIGLCLGRLDRVWNIERWLERTPPANREQAGSNRFDIIIPGPVLGAIALVGLIAASIFGCYLYYPPIDEIFEEMRVIQAEVLTAATSGDEEHAEHFMPIWDDWTRRLEVSTYIRQGRLSEYRRMKTELLRDKMEFLEHAIDEGDKEKIADHVAAVANAYRRVRETYRDDGVRSTAESH